MKNTKNTKDTEVVENSKGFSVKVIIAVIVGVFIIGYGIVWQKNNRETKVKQELNNKEVVNDFILGGNSCYDRSNYFVITRADVSGNAGEDILVKYKINNSQKIDCNYISENNDFELLNTLVADGPSISSAQHFSFIKDNLMIVDEGTGTIRDFIIYDLDKKEQIFTDNYSAGLFELNDNILTYWRKTNDVPNKENCSRVDEYMKMGGAKIEGKISLNINDLSSRKFEGFRCSYAE